MDDHHFFYIFLWMIVTLAIIHFGFFLKKKWPDRILSHLVRCAGGCSRTSPNYFLEVSNALTTSPCHKVTVFFWAFQNMPEKWKARKACKHGHRYSHFKRMNELSWNETWAIIHSYWMKPPGASPWVCGGWHLGVPKDLI